MCLDAAIVGGVAAGYVFLENFEIEHAPSHTHSLLDTCVNATLFEQLPQNSLHLNQIYIIRKSASMRAKPYH